MSMIDVLLAVERSGLSQALRKSNHLVGAGLQVVHVLGIILLLSSLVLISLRLWGLAFRDQDTAEVARDTSRLMWIGLVAAVGSGALMFISSPRLYYYNPAFDLKMVLLVFAVIVHLILLRVARTSRATDALATRAVVVAALLCWFGVGSTRRIIVFV